jgi:hypothetical protein
VNSSGRLPARIMVRFMGIMLLNAVRLMGQRGRDTSNTTPPQFAVVCIRIGGTGGNKISMGLHSNRGGLHSNRGNL